MNINPGLIILISIAIVSIIGLCCIIISLFEKDIIITQKKKPARFYPQKTDPLDTTIKSILEDENFSIDNWYPNSSETVILDP